MFVFAEQDDSLGAVKQLRCGEAAKRINILKEPGQTTRGIDDPSRRNPTLEAFSKPPPLVDPLPERQSVHER